MPKAPKKNPVTFVTYSGDGEVFVTTPAREKAFLKTFFTDAGRELDLYDRSEHVDEGLLLTSSIKAS